MAEIRQADFHLGVRISRRRLLLGRDFNALACATVDARGRGREACWRPPGKSRRVFMVSRKMMPHYAGVHRHYSTGASVRGSRRRYDCRGILIDDIYQCGSHGSRPYLTRVHRPSLERLRPARCRRPVGAQQIAFSCADAYLNSVLINLKLRSPEVT